MNRCLFQQHALSAISCSDPAPLPLFLNLAGFTERPVEWRIHDGTIDRVPLAVVSVYICPFSGTKFCMTVTMERSKGIREEAKESAKRKPGFGVTI